MAELTITAYVADATALGGAWERFVTLTDTTKAVEIKLHGAVGVVYVQSSTNDLLVTVGGTAGVALDGAAKSYDASEVVEVGIFPTRAPPLAPVSRLYLQCGTNPTVVSLRAQRQPTGA